MRADAPRVLERKVPGGDGSPLHTVVVLPAGPGPHPALLLRTPYSTSSHIGEALGWAARGVAVAIQDVRGRYESGGIWQPYAYETEDGVATLNWMTGQQWCDGRVVAYGSSYAAHCAIQLATATDRPPLTGVIAAVPARSQAHAIREPSGACRLLAHAWWWVSQGDCRSTRGPLLDLLQGAGADVLQALPIADLPEAIGLELPGWAAAWDDHPARPTLPTGTADAPPILVIAGLYDVYCDDAIDLWASWGGPVAHLVVGAWQHDLGLTHRDRNGDRPRSPGHRIPVSTIIAGWLKRSLEDSLPDGRRGVAAVESTPGWRAIRPAEPPPVLRLPLEVQRGTFLADPHDPHPSVLGPLRCDEALTRADAAVLVTAPLAEAATIAGAPAVRVDSVQGLGDAAGLELDWAARLIAIGADGTAIQLAHTLVRVRSGRPLELCLPTVSLRLRAGDRLAVQISGHMFPLFPRDPQDGSDAVTATRLHRAHRSVSGPATLHLPVDAVAATETDPADFVERLVS